MILNKSSFFDDVRYKKVAVVGNSLSLFDKEYGEDIDKHDLVIRFNKPAILLENNTFKTHGSKFNFWAFWAVGAFYNAYIDDNESNNSLKHAFRTNKSIKKIQASVNGHASCTRDFIDYTLDRQYYIRLVSYLVSNSRNPRITPSVGLCILEWLRQSDVESVSIFGVDFKKTPTFSEIEQFENDVTNQFDCRCMHDFATEEKYAREVILTDDRFELFQ